ncbi:MAG: ABC transporter permease [Calditrichaeota bacterium]|nr:ABC transporter permease [Calditrichota bacterium]
MRVLYFFLRFIGKKSLTFVSESGTAFILFVKSMRALSYVVKDRHLVFEQMYEIGVRSLPLVITVGIFTGAVSAWQAAYQFKGYLPLSFVGPATAKAIFIELGPVLTALVLAGRVGASIAAELGSMKVTEQIDALETLAIDPIRFLAMPRILASTTMMPILVIFSDLIALIGAFLVSNMLLHISTEVFFNGVKEYFIVYDVLSGLVKALVFGATTAIAGCYIGFETTGGAEGVGRSTIKAFVISSALILMNDYIIAMVLF